MASFVFSCPYCQGQFHAQEEWIGAETQCPICHHTVTIRPTINTLPVYRQQNLPHQAEHSVVPICAPLAVPTHSFAQPYQIQRSPTPIWVMPVTIIGGLALLLLLIIGGVSARNRVNVGGATSNETTGSDSRQYFYDLGYKIGKDIRSVHPGSDNESQTSRMLLLNDRMKEIFSENDPYVERKKDIFNKGIIDAWQ